MTIHLRAAVLASVALTALASAPAHAGDPLTWEVPADEGSCVRLVTGGPRGCGMVPCNIDPNQPAQVWHVPWQEGGLVRGRPALWPINDHGRDVAPPRGAISMTVMDHTILIVYGPDGRTPVQIGEFLPEAEGNWRTWRPGDPKFDEYMNQLQRGRLIPGPRGTTNGNPVGATYGLGDHCCTNTANAQIDNPYGRGRPARGLNWVGYQMNRCGATPFLRDRLLPGLNSCRARANDCAVRFAPTAARGATCGPDMINNALVFGEGGYNAGSNLTGLLTDDPYVRATGGGAGALWTGTMGVELAYFSNTGEMLLAPRYSPTYHTGRALQTCARGGGRLLVQGGRAAATNPLTIVVAGGVYLNYQAYQYSVAVDELASMNDLSGISEDEFEAMIPYNVVSSAYWRNVGAFYGLCDPLPPPRTTFRGRPRGGGCGGQVAMPNVDPPYEEGAGDDAGGCSTGGAAGGGGGAVVMIVLVAIVRRRRAR